MSQIFGRSQPDWHYGAAPSIRKRFLDFARNDKNTTDMKKLGTILLALFLIIDALLGFGVNIGPLVFLLYVMGFAAGVLILISALKSSG